MALVLNVDSKTEVHIALNLNEIIDRLIKKEGVVDDEENDTAWIDYNKLVEVFEEISRDSYFLIRNGSMGKKKLIINAPKDLTFYRRQLLLPFLLNDQ